MSSPFLTCLTICDRELLGFVRTFKDRQHSSFPNVIHSTCGLEDPGMEVFRIDCDCSGAVSAALVGACTFAASFRASIVLLTFYLTSSKMTAWCEERKSDDEDFKAGGQRNWKQVLPLAHE